MNHLITITKSDGTKQLFEEEKLVQSLRRVGASAEVIDEVVDEVEREMWDGMKTDDIYHRAFELLRHRATHVAIKYSTRRALMELGPDGFPFEKMVARIFQAWGYETLTDQMVAGACVEHEMDVVAWKGDELAMVEAKFHNEFGMRSDLKVALYVKARFDDIADTLVECGGKKRKLTDRYLFTNTKFTDKAIAYGECKDLKLIGWNYPHKGNLHDILEQNGLHPITCITSLTHNKKHELVMKGIILCADIVANKEVLSTMGMQNDEIEKIVAEAQMIVDTVK